MIKNVKLQYKLTFSFLFLSITPFLCITFLLLNLFVKDLQKQAMNQLVSVRDIKKQQIQDYFHNIGLQTQNFTSSSVVLEMQESLNSANFTGNNLKENVTWSHEQITILRNLYVPGSGDKLAASGEGTNNYHLMHSLNHEYFWDFIKKFGYSDMFLVNLDGFIVYSVKKESNFATNLSEGAYRASHLSEAFHAVLNYQKEHPESPLPDDLTFFTDFQIDSVTQEVVAYITTPISDFGELKGVLIYQLPLIHLNTIMGERSGLGKTGETLLIGMDRLVRSNSYRSPEKHSVKSSFSNQKFLKSDFVDQVISGKTGQSQGMSYHGDFVLSAFTPIEVFNQKWGVIAEIGQDEANGNVKSFLHITLISAIILLLIVGLLAYGLSRTISSPLVKMIDRLKDIAKGNGDLTQRLNILSKDETGELAFWFNEFIQKVQEVVLNIHTNAQTLAASAEELSRGASAMEESSNHITGSIHDETSALNQTSETMTNMVKSMGKIFQSIKGIMLIANKAEQVATHGSDMMNLTENKMKAIEVSTKKIENVIEVITEIANQTNLLALNAAIEAAKAGDSGRGFAVVADEVRKLAENSQKAVEQIQTLIIESRDSVTEGANVISQTQQVFQNIINDVQKISNQLTSFTSIDVVAQEKNLHEMSNGIQIVSDLGEKNSTSVEELSNIITETSHTSGDLSVLADNLMSKVSLFKVS